jgi:DNA-binding transcriptional LysR family regulator
MAQRSMRGEVGSLSIGFLVWGTGAFFPKIIQGFRRRHEGVQLSLLEILPAAQSEALMNGTIDVGFTRPLQPPYDRQLKSELIYMDPLVAVLPGDHPLAKGPLPIEALADERFILCDRDISPTLFDTITALCAQAGFTPRITQTSNVLSSVLTLVQAGEGVTLIPSSLQLMRFNDLAFCKLTTHTGAVELVMAWSPKRDSTVQRSFLDFVRNKKEFIQRTVSNRPI